MKKCNILIPIGCRSDEGLSAPVIRRLKEQDWCNVLTYNLVPAIFGNNYQFIEDLLRRGYKKEYKPDLVIITGDRIEMMACAQACFLNHVKIAHFYAGVIDYSFVLFDDIHRHCITLMSDIAFCEDSKSADIVIGLWTTIGKIKKNYINYHKYLEENNIHIVGCSHLDDLEIDESLVPKEDCGSCKDLIDCNNTDKGCVVPYDLLLFNEITIGKEIRSFLQDKHLIIIGPNPDSSIPLQRLIIDKRIKDYTYYNTLPRAQFLGLLKRCQRFITNSSSAYYEAPYLMKDPNKIVMIGKRNKNRSTPKKLETGASDKIVQILKEWWQNEQL